MVDIAAMHDGVHDELADGIRRNLIHIMPVHAIEPSSQMDVAQHILVGLFDELPCRSGELAPIHEHRLGVPLEYPALHYGTYRFITGQDCVGVGRQQLAVSLDQHSPRQQLSACDGFDALTTVGVAFGDVGHPFAESIDVLIRNGQAKARCLIETAVAAFEHQFPDRGFIRLPGGAGDAYERTLVTPQRLDVIRALHTRLYRHINDGPTLIVTQ